MKLLTPKAAASMHNKAKGFGRLAEMLGTDDPEKLETIIQELKSRERAAVVKVPEYHEKTEIWLDEELISMGEDERDRICREIGNAGEQYAFELVCQELLDRGCQLVEEEVGLVRFAGENEEYTVHRPDMAGHHQAGWDIKVTCRFSQDDEDTPPKAASWYLEVKTHTPGSVRKGILRISNEQMKLAASHGENYFLLSITYNYKKKQVTGLNTYKDPCRQLASGKLANASDCYLLLEKVLV